jgi:ABC-type tungstate transport system permease subunit
VVFNRAVLLSIIVLRAKQCTGVHTYTATPIKKTVNVDKTKHIIIVLKLLAKSVFKALKNMPYTVFVLTHLAEARDR